MSDPSASKKVSPLLVVMVAIAVVCSLLFLMPSQSQKRREMARERLASDYKLLKSDMVATFKKGTLLKLKEGERANVYVTCDLPVVRSSGPAWDNAFDQILNSYSPYECNITVLPVRQPKSIGWDLYARLLLLNTYKPKSRSEMEAVRYGIQTWNPSVVANAKKRWADTPAEIRGKIESQLEANLELTKNLPSSKMIVCEVDGKQYQVKDIGEIESLISLISQLR